MQSLVKCSVQMSLLRIGIRHCSFLSSACVTSGKKLKSGGSGFVMSEWLSGVPWAEVGFGLSFAIALHSLALGLLMGLAKESKASWYSVGVFMFSLLAMSHFGHLAYG